MNRAGGDLKAELVPAMEERFPGAVAEVLTSRGEPYLRLHVASLVPVCLYLRDDPRWRFDFLAALSGVDWLERDPRFEVVYHLRSVTRNLRLGMKVNVPDDTVAVPSVSDVWKSADWMEREVFDLYGIRFEGHRNLKRIMMPDDWEGHPYRRDYPLEGVE